MMLLRFSRRVAPQEYVAGIGEDLLEEGNTQGVLRRLLEKADRSRGRRRLALRSAQIAKHFVLDVGDHGWSRVFSCQSIGRDTGRARPQLREAFDERMCLTTERVELRCHCQCLEQERATRTRRGDDDQRSLKTVSWSGRAATGAR